MGYAINYMNLQQVLKSYFVGIEILSSTTCQKELVEIT